MLFAVAITKQLLWEAAGECEIPNSQSETNPCKLTFLREHSRLGWRKEKNYHAVARSFPATHLGSILVGGFPRDVACDHGTTIGSRIAGRLYSGTAGPSRVVFRN